MRILRAIHCGQPRRPAGSGERVTPGWWRCVATPQPGAQSAPLLLRWAMAAGLAPARRVSGGAEVAAGLLRCCSAWTPASTTAPGSVGLVNAAPVAHTSRSIVMGWGERRAARAFAAIGGRDTASD